MNDQLSIILEKNAEKVDTVKEVLIEGYDDYIKCYFGRTESDAPESAAGPLKEMTERNARIRREKAEAEEKRRAAAASAPEEETEK